MDNFASLDTPEDPGGVKVVELSGMKPKSADSVTVIYTMEHYITPPRFRRPQAGEIYHYLFIRLVSYTLVSLRWEGFFESGNIHNFMTPLLIGVGLAQIFVTIY